jgi:endonuclease YncB( thermonuclease family)
MIAFDFKRQLRPAADHRLYHISDGDTPTILQPVRMVSIDTPEKAHYAGKPETAQPKLDRCRQLLLDGAYPEIPDGLRRYLLDRLDPDAAARHIAAGEQATSEFDLLLQERLTRPDGSQRPVATIPTGEVIDRYGRMLAYLAPWYTGTRSDPLPRLKADPRRRTFNLDMVAAGWATSFLVYPSLPDNEDLNLLLDEARTAWSKRRGAWKAHGRTLLLGYEYRLAIKLGTISSPADAMNAAFQRVCVDLRTLRPLGLYGWWATPPPERLWIWTTDTDQAAYDLGIELTR